VVHKISEISHTWSVSRDSMAEVALSVLSDLLRRQVSAVQFFGTLAKGLVALAAAKALIPSAVASKSLAFNSAIVARHGSCLSREACP